ncbi:DUF1365 domain-containing protein [Denitromonas sp.]|uniref:DUF1365 domain-containing protein n=1 Tax=Denitromonas sp. TaxID=2734609 RepID=UPI002AFEEA64|nr:DUF1365 domain-containing protein [Denitromonas sp.]
MSALPERPALFIGTVYHRRVRPVANAFTYPVFYVQLPVADPATARGPMFAVDGWGVLGFRTRDHGPRDGSPLRPWIRARLREHGLPDDGPVMLQCFPRVLGYVFNPVSFWFCHRPDGALIAVLAEVNNTFGGRHSYLLHHPDGRPLRDGETLRADKAFHVSPFCDVVGGYRFRFHLDGPRPRVHIDYDDAEGELLCTVIGGRAQPWRTGRLLRAFFGMPFLTAGVMLRIHWQALRLWLKGVPFRGARPARPAQAPEP